MTLSIKGFALAGGIVWGLAMFLLTWWIIFTGGSAGGGEGMIARVYLGYSVSPVGSIVGLIWGFVDGVIGGAVFAWLYNKLSATTA